MLAYSILDREHLKDAPKLPKLIDENNLFKVALDTLIAHGYEGATTQKIAELAGVNEVTIFRKYGNKSRLFEKVIEHELADTPLNAIRYTGNLHDDLLRIVDAYIETNRVHGSIIPLLLIELPRHPDLRGMLDTPWKNLQGIIQTIRKHQERGVLRSESPLSALSALIGPIVISQMFQRARPDLPVPAIDARAHVVAFLGGRRT